MQKGVWLKMNTFDQNIKKNNFASLPWGVRRDVDPRCFYKIGLIKAAQTNPLFAVGEKEWLNFGAWFFADWENMQIFGYSNFTMLRAF